METSELNHILDQHRIWLETNGVQGGRAYLRGADLRRANLTDANLINADLSGADLSGANLSFAILTGANLTDAYLRGANLRGANLRGANLRGANLWGASLTSANLWRADLRGAFLRDANLYGANLYGATLTGAKLTGTNLSNAISPDISWIIPGCLAQLNEVKYGLFYLKKENKFENFIQDSFGFFIQNNEEEGTFDMLLGDRIIRGIPDWVKYSGLKKLVEERKL